MKNIILVTLFTFWVVLLQADTLDDSKKHAIFLFSEFFDKLESNSPFTTKDDNKFFGDIPNFNPTTQFYIHKGYIDSPSSFNSEIVSYKKKLPYYSFYGELLRINRNKFIENHPPKLFYASESFSISDDKLSHVDFIITVFMTTRDKVFYMNYDVHKKILLAPLYMNGSSILYRLGISKGPFQDNISSEWEEKLEAHFEQMKNRECSK